MAALLGLSLGVNWDEQCVNVHEVASWLAVHGRNWEYPFVAYSLVRGTAYSSRDIPSGGDRVLWHTINLHQMGHWKQREEQCNINYLELRTVRE